MQNDVCRINNQFCLTLSLRKHEYGLTYIYLVEKDAYGTTFLWGRIFFTSWCEFVNKAHENKTIFMYFFTNLDI